MTSCFCFSSTCAVWGPIRPLVRWGIDIYLLGLVMAMITWPSTLIAQAAAVDSGVHQRDYTSQKIRLRTDVEPDQAKRMLRRMEKTLRRISSYWRSPLKGSIECYVVEDMKRWPENSFPNPSARALIQFVGGVTLTKMQVDSRKSELKAIVYATSAPGVVEHEVVHAYCFQTFGKHGPDWYKEGMADVAGRLADPRSATRCPMEITSYLRGQTFRPVDEIVSSGPFTQPLIDIKNRLTRVTKDSVETYLAPSLSVWGAPEDEILQEVQSAYRWSWALCHFLVHSPNYSQRFRAYGQGHLDGSEIPFSKWFADVRNQLDFEFDFFVGHSRPGYRVELCNWDWTVPWSSLKERAIRNASVRAAAGYQATGCSVSPGETYHYRTLGSCCLSQDGAGVTAAGDRSGRGKLVAVVMQDYKLSEEIELGESGSFSVPSSGHLYLRCRDDWGSLADNSGGLRVRLQSGPASPSPGFNSNAIFERSLEPVTNRASRN